MPIWFLGKTAKSVFGYMLDNNLESLGKANQLTTVVQAQRTDIAHEMVGTYSQWDWLHGGAGYAQLVLDPVVSHAVKAWSYDFWLFPLYFLTSSYETLILNRPPALCTLISRGVT